MSLLFFGFKYFFHAVYGAWAFYYFHFHGVDFIHVFGVGLFTAVAVGLCHFLCVQKVAQKDALAAGWQLLFQYFVSMSRAAHPALTRHDRHPDGLTYCCSHEPFPRC